MSIICRYERLFLCQNIIRKVKKAGKAVELTDESVLSGYGDPLGTAINQIAMSSYLQWYKIKLTAIQI